MGEAQLCIYHHGERVVDLWCRGEVMNDRETTGDSLHLLMSATKGVTATAVHLLSERGVLDLDAPIAKYWPEFASGGKESLPLSYVLSHRSGLSAFRPEDGIDIDDLVDWERCVSALATMQPYWVPGTAYFYHAMTYGYLIGETIRRVTGQTIGALLAEEIAGPLELDLWIGLPEREEPRFVPSLHPSTVLTLEAVRKDMGAHGIDTTAPFVAATLDSFDLACRWIEASDTPVNHAAELPAANGVGSARSLAKLFAATVGEVDGLRLLQPETIRRATEPQTAGLTAPPPLDKFPTLNNDTFGLGYLLAGSTIPMTSESAFYHSGSGGQLAWADPRHELGVGYLCSNLSWDGRGPDPRWLGWSEALRLAVAQHPP
jgi:CubicO group peptidase (beta-lactamase class C family)